MDPATPKERWSLAVKIAERARHLRKDVRAIGIYGSVARGEDGPYSDLEIICVLASPGEDFTTEWIARPCKVEVNFVSADVLFARAAEVEADWPLTHGAYASVHPIYDPDRIFPKLKEAVLAAPRAAFSQAIRNLIVEDLYELVGKVRNAWYFRATEELPFLAVELAFYGALLVGLANRHLYRSASKMLGDSLGLSDRPEGYDPLCRRVLAGDLRDPEEVFQACEAFWAGVEAWAWAQGIPLSPEEIPF